MTFLTFKTKLTMTRCIVVSYLEIPVLFFLQNNEQIGVATWLLVTLVICIDPLYGQYTLTSDLQTA